MLSVNPKKISTLLLLLVGVLCLILVTHLVSVHYHTESHALAPHGGDLKSKLLADRGKKTSSLPNLHDLYNNETLTNLSKELLLLRNHLERLNSINLHEGSTANSAQHNPDSQPGKPTSQLRSVANQAVKHQQQSEQHVKKAVIFTMDCIPSYEENSRGGGASGIALSINHAANDKLKLISVNR